jgi:hypothetical protein
MLLIISKKLESKFKKLIKSTQIRHVTIVYANRVVGVSVSTGTRVAVTSLLGGRRLTRSIEVPILSVLVALTIRIGIGIML